MIIVIKTYIWSDNLDTYTKKMRIQNVIENWNWQKEEKNHTNNNKQVAPIQRWDRILLLLCSVCCFYLIIHNKSSIYAPLYQSFDNQIIIVKP